jgi:hypothetical protein
MARTVGDKAMMVPQIIMSTSAGGVQGILSGENPRAVYVHCNSHIRLKTCVEHDGFIGKKRMKKFSRYLVTVMELIVGTQALIMMSMAAWIGTATLL